MSDETAVTPAVSEDIFNAVTQIAEVSIDWRSLNGGEIYDRFIQKGAKPYLVEVDSLLHPPHIQRIPLLRPQNVTL